MIPRHMRATDPFDPTSLPPSKSRRKRDMIELQALGEALVGLPEDQLRRLELPDVLREAVVEARRIHAFGALRRQLQFVGKVMRDIDPAPIRLQLDALRGVSAQHIAWMHTLERWRVRLLADDAATAEWIASHPTTDSQRLRTLIRNARHEREAGKPSRAFRELFQVLRDLIPDPVASLQADTQEAPPDLPDRPMDFRSDVSDPHS